MAEAAYEATKIQKGKTPTGEMEVDALIAGALAELDTSPKLERELKATPIPVAKPKEEPKEEPKPIVREAAKEEVKAEEKVEEKEPAYEETFKKFVVGSLIKGKVVRLDQSGALVDIGYKSDGFIAPEELSPEIKVGDMVEAIIEKLESKDGYVILSKEQADFESKWKKANEAFKDKRTVEAKVLSAVNGGLVAEFEGVRGFIPASQVSKRIEQPLKEFVGKVVPVKVIEANRRQGKIILSHRLGSVETEKVKAHKIFEEIEVGQVRHGKVSSLKSFGAFVDLDGAEGLIHLSELSWKRVKHPSEVIKSGQEIDVFVLGVDKINRKISLGLKELQVDPWAAVDEKYKVGQLIKVRIARVVKFGAFAEIEDGLEGLVHISELSQHKINSPEDAVKPGDMVDAKILRIIPEEQRIGLSIRDAEADKARAEAEAKRKEEAKVTIGEIIAQKEKQKAEREAELAEEVEEEEAVEEIEEEVVEEVVTEEEIKEEEVQDQGLT